MLRIILKSVLLLVMKKIKLKFEDQSRNWNIWQNKSEIEKYTASKRSSTRNECAKQLTDILKNITKRGE